MDELIRMVSQRTGLPAEQARQAAEAVIAFMKDKLPAPIASQLDSFIGGSGSASAGTGAGAGGGLGDLASGLGGMFGGGKK